MTTEVQRLRSRHCNVDFHPHFLTPEEAEQLYRDIEAHCQWNREVAATRRSTQSYGDTTLTYEVTYMGATSHRHPRPWADLPALLPIKERLERLTNQEYNVCVVQRYPNGKIGIGPHRDKEMTLGTTIAGVSLHTTRTLQLSSNADGERYQLPLRSGSLYLLNPPTNSFWTHAILTDQTTTPRISLTFRNYRGVALP